MSARVYAAISHKGGAGRSTASANIAYQAANAGHSVCLVDLDLDSATLGSVLGLSKQTVGARLGIQTLLAQDAPAGVPLEEVLIDLNRAEFKERLTFSGSNHGAFYLLPGNSQQRELVDEVSMVPILDDVLRRLSSQFDLVLIDVRAGKSGVVRAILEVGVGLPHFQWLLFYRWTHQHLAAAHDMVHTLRETDRGRSLEIVPIATARIARESVGDHLWFQQQYDDLRVREDREIARLVGRDPFAIPFDRVFQWKEQILLPSRREASPATVTAFRELASALVVGV